MPVLMMKNVLWFTCVLFLNNYSIICTAQSETSRRSFQYTILPDTGKWHLLLWQHLAVIENTSTVECGIACLHVGNDCKAFATRNYNQCLLLGSFRPTSGTLWMNSNGEWTIFRKENDELEMPVFRASSGKGVEVYPSWTDGTRSSLSDAELAQSLDLRSSLSTFYKHPLVDSWNEWIITKVILSFYTYSDEVVRVEFNGTNSNATSWFALSNLISSPWIDLNTGTQVNKFTVSIEYPNQHRKFYINSEFGDCDLDTGWMAVFDRGDHCSWSWYGHFPQFIYALQGKRQVWTNLNAFGSAQDIIISVVLRL